MELVGTPEHVLNTLVTLWIVDRTGYYRQIDKFMDGDIIDRAIQHITALMAVISLAQGEPLRDYWGRIMLGYARLEAGLDLDE